MNQKIKDSKEKAIEAIREYRKLLLEEFLLVAKQLQKEINNLYETGINEKLFICLEGAQVEQDICYTVIGKREILELLDILGRMDAENAITLLKRFEKENEWNVFYDYPEFEKMEKILDTDQNAQYAEDFISMQW